MSDDPFNLTQAEVDELNEVEATEDGEYSDDPGNNADIINIVAFIICNISRL